MSLQQYNFYPILTPVRVVQLTNLAGTYFNGITNNGVGATLTGAATTLTIDAVLLQNGDRVLLQGQTSGLENGIYVVSGIGSNWVLTRSDDMHNIEDMKPGMFVSVGAGTVNAGSGFVLAEPLPSQIGLAAIVFTASPLNSALGTAAGKAASDNAQPSLSSVVGATTVNALAVFADVAGSVKNASTTSTLGFPLIVSGNVSAGKSGTAGILASFPAGVTTGSLRLVGVANGGNFNVDISNRSHGQATVYSIADVGQATGSLLNSAVAADPGANVIGFDVTCGQAALAGAGSVTLYASSAAKQFKILDLYINSGGTNFSGGGGDRLGQVTDGTTVYSVVPAATLQALVNGRWGSTDMPFPAAAALNVSTVAGASLLFKYSGGTTDYTAGSVVISGLIKRVA